MSVALNPGEPIIQLGLLVGLARILLSQGDLFTDDLELVQIALLILPQSLGVWNRLQLEDVHLAALKNADALIFLRELDLVEKICFRPLVNDNLLENAYHLVNILLHPLGENGRG